MVLPNLFNRLTARDGRAEADVALCPLRINYHSRAGGRFVGRTAPDADFSGETGAERRTRHLAAVAARQP